ncbi:MAG: hypothetical protein Q7R96_05090 [Nanoarchaeota archaeon]|nr:hypothetical protein [Nanoarchaeota archaeon]
MGLHIGYRFGRFEASYVTRPVGNPDEVVRNAFDMVGLEPAVDTMALASGLTSSYIIEGDKYTLYATSDARMIGIENTVVKVIIPKKEGPIIVEIASHLRCDQPTLEKMVRAVVLPQLSNVGLAPVDSTVDQIPTSVFPCDK